MWYARGGTGALVRSLATTFVDAGGELRLGRRVEGVRLQGGGAGAVHRVRTAAGEEPFDVVVSNADVHHTYAALYDGVAAAAEQRRWLERLDWSMSLFLLYLGTDRTWDGVAHHTILFGPRWRALLDDIFRGDALPHDASVYLHAPTVTDPTVAPPGRGTFYVLAPVPHLARAAVDWDEEAPRHADRILALLEAVLPGVRQHVTTRRWFTPRDFERELGAFRGAAFSIAPTLAQSAWFRPHNRDGRIPGLYLVGAGTHPGAGVPGVLASAKATTSLVLRDLGVVR